MDVKKLHINPRFETALPFLTKKEYKALERSILEEGVRNPIIVWNNTIIDGHHRYKICLKHDIPFKIIEKKFESEDDAFLWILREQYSRRNQTRFGRGVTIGRYYNNIKKPCRGKTREKGDDFPRMTSELVAKLFGVSPTTVIKWGKIAEHLETVIPQLQQKFLTGEMPYRLIDVLMHLPKEEQYKAARMPYQRLRNKYLPKDAYGRRRPIIGPKEKEEVAKNTKIRQLAKKNAQLRRENKKLREVLENVKATIKKWNLSSLFDIPKV